MKTVGLRTGLLNGLLRALSPMIKATKYLFSHVKCEPSNVKTRSWQIKSSHYVRL